MLIKNLPQKSDGKTLLQMVLEKQDKITAGENAGIMNWLVFRLYLLFRFVLMQNYSCSQTFTYTLQNLLNVNYFTKIRGIIQNSCFFFF